MERQQTEKELVIIGKNITEIVRDFKHASSKRNKTNYLDESGRTARLTRRDNYNMRMTKGTDPKRKLTPFPAKTTTPKKQDQVGKYKEKLKRKYITLYMEKKHQAVENNESRK